MPTTLQDENGNELLTEFAPLAQLVQDHFDCPLTSLERKAFCNATGKEWISSLATPDALTLLPTVLVHKPYALACLAALLGYLESKNGYVLMPGSIRFQFIGTDGTMLIDHLSAKYLELDRNLVNGKAYGSLFGTLNHTSTPMGARLLRKSILEPSTGAST